MDISVSEEVQTQLDQVKEWEEFPVGDVPIGLNFPSKCIL